MATEKKVAFITGGNRGIGLETARQLAQTGVKVVIGSRNLEAGKTAAEKLSAEGLDVQAIRFDITKSADYKEAYAYFDKNYGKLDILINNAGVSKEEFMAGNNASVVTRDVLHETFNTNFFGTVELTQILLPLIKKAPEGRPEYVYRFPGGRAERHNDQGELRAPRLGQN